MAAYGDAKQNIKLSAATNEGVTTAFQTFVQDDNGPEIRTVFAAMLIAISGPDLILKLDVYDAGRLER